jgi:MFS family permease
LFSSAWVVPAVIGPAISGYVVQSLGWRWLFLGILILLLPTAALILPSLSRRTESDSRRQHASQRMRWAWVAALGSLCLSLSASAGALAPVAVLLALCALAFAAARLLPPGTVQLARGLPTVIAMRGMNASAFFLCEAFVPLWLHQERGWSITAAGLALTGGALSWSIGSHLQSRIVDESHRRAWLRRGCLMLCIGIACSGFTVLNMLPSWMLVIGWSIAGLGTGVSLPMLGVLTLKLAPHAQQGTYSSALQLCAALGTGAALAAGGLMFSLIYETTSTLAYASVFMLAALLAILAWIAVPRVVADEFAVARIGSASESG